MVIIVDIDGTIADTKERARKYLETSPKDWDKFYDSCAEDKPINGVIEVVRHLEQNNYVIFVSGRRESCRKDTVEWINRNLPFLAPPTPSFTVDKMVCYSLYLRENGDTRHDTVVKPELLEKAFKEERIDKSKVLCILEDRNSMVRKWRELGYTCLQVAEGDF